VTSAERHRRWSERNQEHLRRYQKAWRAKNRERVRAYSRKHYKYDPVKAREKQLRRNFGITLAKYESMRLAQRDTCALCSAAKPGGRGGWHVDHDHKTGKVRQLLCQNCNIGLGSFQDSPALLVKAARYLRRHSRA